MTRPLEDQLRSGARALGLSLTDTQAAQLLDYLGLIQKWTRVYNLTAVREPAEMLTHHVLDSLAVVGPLLARLEAWVEAHSAPCPPPALRAPPLPAQNAPPPIRLDNPAAPGEADRGFRLLDVGSGAGLPGVVIAICCPQVAVDCVDTVAKKAAFIQQVAATLKLPNLRGIHARVENLSQTYGVVSSRAFASLADFTSLSARALAGEGIWLAMKGKYPTDELAALPPTIEVFHVEQLQVPGLDAERCVLWMRKKELVGH